MSVTLAEVIQYLDSCLQPGQFQDYCPNGLQVEGRPAITRLATGVTASQRLLDQAIAWEADAILVHHGYFWRGEDPAIVGIKRKRIAALLINDVSLLAYHLPLDAHPQYGNNARLGQLMGLDSHEPLQPGSAGSVGNIASLPEPIAAGKLVSRLQEITGRIPLHIGNGD